MSADSILTPSEIKELREAIKKHHKKGDARGPSKETRSATNPTKHDCSSSSILPGDRARGAAGAKSHVNELLSKHTMDVREIVTGAAMDAALGTAAG